MKNWKEIPGHLGYEVSDEGNLRNSKTGKALAFRIDNNKLYITLNLQNINVTTLVYDIFNGEYPTQYPREFYTTYPKDKNPSNCHIDNIGIRIRQSAIRAFDYEGNMLGDYSSAAAFMEENPIKTSVSNVIKASSGAATSAGGLQFKKLNDCFAGGINQLASLMGRVKVSSLPVAKYFNDRLICVYNSVTEAAEANDAVPTRIHSSINTNTKCGIFKYKRIS